MDEAQDAEQPRLVPATYSLPPDMKAAVAKAGHAEEKPAAEIVRRALAKELHLLGYWGAPAERSAA